MKRHVFIINAPAEDAVASAIMRDVGKNGVEVFSSDSTLPDPASTEKKIKNSDAVVIIVSAAAGSSAGVKSMTELAVRTKRDIIPFRIDTAPLPKYLEFYMSSIQWLDASSPPAAKHFPALKSAIRHSLGLDRERVAKKTIVALIFGIISIFALSILGFGAVILGIIDLRAIARGKSHQVGKKYAVAAVILGTIGLLTWGFMLYLIIYHDFQPP